MRQGNNPRRGRGRAGRRPNVPSRNQTFDSNGPEGRVRGTAQQVYDKYLALARDAQAAGDRVLAENFLQFAEHYFRILNDSTDPDDRDRQRINGEARSDDRQARERDEQQDDWSDDEDQESESDGEEEARRSAPREGGQRDGGQRGGRPQHARGERGGRSRDGGGRSDEPRTRREARNGEAAGDDQSLGGGEAERSKAEATFDKPFDTAPPLSERRARRQARSDESQPSFLSGERDAPAAADQNATDEPAGARQESEAGESDEGLRKMLGERPRRAPRRRRTAAQGEGDTDGTAKNEARSGHESGSDEKEADKAET